MKPSKFAQPFRDYEILDRLGSGGMGTVFKARRKDDGVVVALKVLRPSYSRNQRYVERLRREAEISMRLDHPNLVKGLGMGEEGGYHYLVMEFVEAKSLKEMLKTWGRFPEEQVLAVGIQLGEALAYAHENGVVHRDVKPGNVLVDAEDRVKLTDLGLAKGDTDMTLTRDGSTVGTPQYMSPEQARDPQLVDARSDLYSLGATLYHMAVGLPPFEGESVVQVITKLLHERADSAGSLNPDLSTGLNLILRRLLAKDPALRYQTAAELLDDLRRVQAGQAPGVDVKALERAEGRRRKPVPARLLLAGASVVAVVAVGAWLLRSPPPTTQLGDFDRLVRAVRDLGSDSRAKLDLIDAYAPASAEQHLAKVQLRDGVEQELRQRVEAFASELSEDDFLRWLEANGAANWRQRYLREHVEDAFTRRFQLRPSELPGAARDAWQAFLVRHESALVAANDRRLASIVQRLQAAWSENAVPAVAKARERRDYAAADSLLARLSDDLWTLVTANATPIPRLVEEERDRLLPLERKVVDEQLRLRQEAARLIDDYRGRVQAELDRIRQRVRDGYVADADGMLAACRTRLGGSKPWVSLPQGLESPVPRIDQDIERVRHELEARILDDETRELAWREDTVHLVLARDLDVGRALSFLDGVTLVSPETKRARDLLRADLEALRRTIDWLLGRIEERRGQACSWRLQRVIVDGRLQRVQRGDKPGLVLLAEAGERTIGLAELDRAWLVATFAAKAGDGPQPGDQRGDQRLGLGLFLYYGDCFREAREHLADTDRHSAYVQKEARRSQHIEEIGRNREAQARRLLTHLESLLPAPGLPFRDWAATSQDLEELRTSFADTRVVAEAADLLVRVHRDLSHERRRLELLGRLPQPLRAGARLTVEGEEAGAAVRMELDLGRDVAATSEGELLAGWLPTAHGLAAPPVAVEHAHELGAALGLPLPFLDERSEAKLTLTLIAGSEQRGVDLVQMDILGTRLQLIQPPGEPAYATAETKLETALAARGAKVRETTPMWYLLAGARYDVVVDVGAVQNLKRAVTIRVNDQDAGLLPQRAAATAPLAALGLAAVGDVTLARIVVEGRAAK